MRHKVYVLIRVIEARGIVLVFFGGDDKHPKRPFRSTALQATWFRSIRALTLYFC